MHRQPSPRLVLGDWTTRGRREPAVFHHITRGVAHVFIDDGATIPLILGRAAGHPHPIWIGERLAPTDRETRPAASARGSARGFV